MKTILVDAINGLVLENGNILASMHDLLETYPNRKIVLTGANDEQFKQFNLDKLPYEVFTLKHNPEKTDPEYFRILLEKYGLTVKDVVYFEQQREEYEKILTWCRTVQAEREQLTLQQKRDFL